MICRHFILMSQTVIVNITFDNCVSEIDTYVYLFVWNDTLQQWLTGYGYQWHQDDNDCVDNINDLGQERFTIYCIVNEYYHLVISAQFM